MMECFRTHLAGTFIVDDRQVALSEMADKYNDMCEVYDLSVCSLKDDKGVARPVTCTESVLINKNARKVFDVLSIAYAEWCFSRSELIKAVSMRAAQ